MAVDLAALERPRLSIEPYGTLDDGRTAQLFVLTARNGIEVRITNYGGVVLAVRTPDREGKFDDIVLGFDRLEDYVRDTQYVGCLIGRYANRIAGGRLVLSGRRFSLEKNGCGHHLHGGTPGFHKVLWRALPFEDERGSGVRLDHRSPDGESGYPGNLAVTVTYRLSAGGELGVDYRARSDKDTVVNFTQHSYFNLDGPRGGSILDHTVVLRARRFTPTDADLIPTGELRSVTGTAFDFTQPRRIGSRIADGDEPLLVARGYDHNWVLDGDGRAPRPVARAASPSTGRVIEIATTEPGLQLYTGNALRSDGVGKGGLPYAEMSGFCMETQHFPDSPNKHHFPSPVLRKGAWFRSTTTYRFSTLHGSAELTARW